MAKSVQDLVVQSLALKMSRDRASPIVPGAELFTDSMRNFHLHDDLVYVFPTKLTKESFGDIDQSLIGGNASQEQQEEAMESQVTSGLDFVLQNRLIDVTDDIIVRKKMSKSFQKKFKTLLTSKMTEDDKRNMKDALAKTWNMFMDKMDNLSIFIGENVNLFDEGGNFASFTPCFVLWDDSGKAGNVYCFKHMVKEEKV